MSFITSMQKRYTTKVYDSSKKIDEKKIRELKEILRLSPSSINSQPWKFTFVSDSKVKTELAEASLFNKERIQDSDTLIVFSSINSIEQFEKQINAELPEGAIGYYNRFIKPQTDEQIQSWLDKQVYLALGIFLSACAEMNIDATPMEGIEPQKYNTILNEKNYTALAAVAIGYRDENDSNQPLRKPKYRREQHQVIRLIQ